MKKTKVLLISSLLLATIGAKALTAPPTTIQIITQNHQHTGCCWLHDAARWLFGK